MSSNMNINALHTDLAAMGIAHYGRGKNAFEMVPPKATEKPCTAPKKRGPKPKPLTMTPKGHQLANARLALDAQGRATVSLKPRTTGGITIQSKADADRNARIRRGRAI